MKSKSIVKSKALSTFLRILLGASVVALILLIFYLYHAGAWRDIAHFYRFFLNPKYLKTFVASFGHYAPVVFIVTQALQVVCAPVPGEITGFVGGYLFGNIWGAVYSTMGLMAGSIIAFGIARRLGMKFVEKVVKKTYIEKFNSFITHKGLYVTFILFLIPGLPKDSLCYLLGLTHMRFLDFVLINLIARLPGTVMLTLQGSAIGKEKYLSFLIIFGVSLVIIFVLYLTRDVVLHRFSHVVQRMYTKFHLHEKKK